MTIDKDTASSITLFQDAVHTAAEHNERLIIPAKVIQQFTQLFDACVNNYYEAYRKGYNAGAGFDEPRTTQK